MSIASSANKLLISALFACSGLVTLQAQTTGVITGTVTDPTGSTIPNAQVTVHDSATGETRTFPTNGSGV